MCLIYLYVLSIPVQPHGMRILMTYKFGSARMGTESHAYGIGTCLMLLRCVDGSPCIVLMVFSLRNVTLHVYLSRLH